jgi:hypothetical protein
MFCIWDVLELGRFEAWDVLRHWTFCILDVLRLGRFEAGTLCLWTFCLWTFCLWTLCLWTFCRCTIFSGSFAYGAYVKNKGSFNSQIYVCTYLSIYQHENLLLDCKYHSQKLNIIK